MKKGKQLIYLFIASLALSLGFSCSSSDDEEVLCEATFFALSDDYYISSNERIKVELTHSDTKTVYNATVLKSHAGADALCGATNTAYFKGLKPGTYSYTAKNNYYMVWRGAVTLTSGCKMVQLKKADFEDEY